ncbi:MAG: DUF4968 domain-containing protein, partial [Bacteroidetes bacterium]|nr:DUF4968 domain-containing protein [Bacteroidota bacterium]
MRNHYLAALLAIVCCTKEIHAQTIGSVTQIQVSGNSLILSSDTNVVIFKVCTDRTLMVNYLPGAHEDPDTLVVANTSWNAAGVTIDTIGNPLRISAATFNVEIDRNPLRFHLYKKNGQMICEEPSIGGINNNSLSLTTTGGPYYGIHNRPQGNLQTQNTNTVSAGNQGGAGGPFVWTTNGWGFLADADGGSFSLYGTTFSFSRPEIPSKRDLEWYFFIGSPKEIFTSMHEVTGFPPLFPKYTLGFMNTEWGMNQTELYS